MLKNKAATFLKLLLLITCLFAVYSAVGLIAREKLLNNTKPFPTWTYNSSNPLLNVWTSWDSGFYYDIASHGYPQVRKDLKVAYFFIPENKWMKIYTGGGLLGDKRFALPYSKDSELISNTVIVTGRPYTDTKVPLFHGYPGISYCTFDGPIDYKRDVEVAKEALTNQVACGSQPCTRSYVTFYSAEVGNVVYQEYFSPEKPDPVITLGDNRPLGLVNNTYKGFGCSTIGTEEIETARSLDYSTSFTTLSFSPLYPLLSKGLSYLFGDIVVAGLFLSFLFFVLSVWVVYKLFSVFLTGRSVYLALIVYLLFPFSFFNYAFLPVSLFNFLFTAVIYFSLQRRYLWGILFCIPLVFTSIYGIFILFPLWFVYSKK